MAMSAKKQLQGSIYNLLKFNKSGSFRTQEGRKKILFKCAEIIVKNGYKIKNIRGLKQKHVKLLVAVWKNEGLEDKTIKNYLSNLRWAATITERCDVVPSNKELGIGKRKYVTNEDKSLKCKDGDTTKIKNERFMIPLQLQRVFGLRHEECLKIKPFLADLGDYLLLQRSWCKGGRERKVPILTEEQRHWLEKAKNLAGHRTHSLIPQNKTYIQHSKTYYKALKLAGFHGSHGLRHAYAHARYRELTGWHCPAKGGQKSKELTEVQKILDHQVRMTISGELGHSREKITAIYLGR